MTNLFGTLETVRDSRVDQFLSLFNIKTVILFTKIVQKAKYSTSLPPYNVKIENFVDKFFTYSTEIDQLKPMSIKLVYL